MKDAVTAAAAAKGQGGEAEAIIVREALAEYFSKRGVILLAAKTPEARTSVKYTVQKLSKAAAKFNKTKKQQAAPSKKSAA